MNTTIELIGCCLQLIHVGVNAAKFRKIFGDNQFDSHFETVDAFATAIEGKQQLLQSRSNSDGSLSLNNADIRSNYVLCTTHIGGERMRCE